MKHAEHLDRSPNGRLRNEATTSSGGAAAATQPEMAVRATYEVGAVRMDLPTSTTLGELVERVSRAGTGHGGLVSIEVLVAPAATMSL